MRGNTVARILIATAVLCVAACSQKTAEEPVTYDQAPLLGAEMPDWPSWSKPFIGTNLVDAFQVQSADTCIGYVDNLLESYAHDQGFRFEGWAWDKLGGGPFKHLVTTDELLRIQGASVKLVERPDVQIALPALVTEALVGFQIVSTTTEFRPTVFGLNFETMKACPIALAPQE